MTLLRGILLLGGLASLGSCLSSDNRLTPAFTTLMTVPPGGYILTVVTDPIGARCFIAGAEEEFTIDPAPGTIALPIGYEGRDLICELEGYEVNRGTWYVQPIGGNTQFIIQREMVPE
ncbi:hypothetical protein [Flexibacterium corallicola]|uniref:hypothetical protein n=1 Tax=Flexibacterium corallicola TaxID=3037259 RepID=UPI00286F212E|nr:hypothetical protein [Pseudovibrio sp. M1P-2-3]